jgi:predicted metalloendopeptidase
MTPQTINAYYRPTMNEIVFPAAILQPPFFDPTADDATNYGSIGAIIGHEFSHGFDDQGRKFDGDGRLLDWWTESDAAEYELRSDGLVTQYNEFEPLPEQKINGELTLGENIADLAGLIMAYRAWKILQAGSDTPALEGFSGDQRFFIGYARSWRAKQRPEYLTEMLVSDPHSPSRYRVIGALRNMPEFYAAFDVKEGDAMYLPDDERVTIW